MPRSATGRLPEPEIVVYGACAISLAIGLLFVFVRAPHPWGWIGFDHYGELALDIARGRGFPTMEVPWGYAYFLAAFYRIAADRPWIPLVVQVALNATLPMLVFLFARTWLDKPTAAVAALLTGVFSFNTVYASTLSSDAMCTWLFMSAMVAVANARSRDDTRWFALVGFLTGLAAQFRPNLILAPGLLALYVVVERRTSRRVAQAAVLLASAGAALAAWTVRNYRLTGQLIPTSVHAGVQLWYGTLQTGPYLHSRAYNPRSVFEAPVFDYTSLERVPIVVEGQASCEGERPLNVTLAYWSDVDRTERRLAPRGPDSDDGRRYTFEIPAPRRNAVLYYYFITEWPAGFRPRLQSTPPSGARAPLVYFISQDHLGDLDVHGDLLDIFDIVRLARHAAWGEPVPFAAQLQRAGVSSAADAVVALMRPWLEEAAKHALEGIDHDASELRFRFSDGSSITVPRGASRSISDLTFTEGIATALMTSRLSLRALEDPKWFERLPRDVACGLVTEITVNQVFYRHEPQQMRRYLTLALDNLRRDPGGFATASAYRALRLFMIQGTSDRFTAQQFDHSRRVYAAATAISIVYLTFFVIGVLVVWWRGVKGFGLPLLMIAYLPFTLAPVLTNMRYSITVQPLMFMFTAVALVAMLRPRSESAAAARVDAGSRTAPGS
jgi:Dolichyl-phosphate-mannose-protein mannosyltransferase